MRRSRAFTLVELMIAVLLIAILASVVVLNLGETRKNARDGQRRADAKQLVGAVVAHRQVKGTTFVTVPNQPCTVTSGSGPLTGAGCVGANGRSFGKVNVINATASTSERYAGVSIVSALRTGGFLGSDLRDPLARGTTNTDMQLPDYVLVRANQGVGDQSFGTSGEVVGVWTVLESTPSQLERDTAAKYPGGTGVSGVTYSFAVSSSAELQRYQSGYASANGIAKPTSP